MRHKQKYTLLQNISHYLIYKFISRGKDVDFSHDCLRID